MNSSTVEEKPVIVSAAGIDFSALQRGDSPRTVFLHGFGGDLHTWDRLFAQLDPKFSALRYDLRGFGKTASSHDNPFRHSDDLLALLNALNLSPCDLVGVSMGASVALNFALNYPEKVRKLILISPGLMAWEWSDSWRQRWKAIVDVARGGEMARARQLFYQHPLFASTRNSNAAQELYDSIMRFSGREWLQNNEQPELPDVDRLVELNVPTLLLTGGRDLDDFQLIANLLEGCVKNIERIDFPEQGHLLQLEKPDECAKSIQTFLAEI
ncbi:alpha/beta fold hydrolase [Pseudomaricurvus sp.]|uniref:alpha/beta fold hydrolase n=1 Tax=Pseudomaricurvus sp. TaxID=2004510 RepID=UPI003F6CA168